MSNICVKANVDVYYIDTLVNDKGNAISKTFKRNKGDVFEISKNMFDILSKPIKDKDGKEFIRIEAVASKKAFKENSTEQVKKEDNLANNFSDDNNQPHKSNKIKAK